MAITLILGGARSGKSSFAERLVMQSGKQPVYIATAEPHDEEMMVRVQQHQMRRSSLWQTWEVPLDLVGALEQTVGATHCVLVDCLSLWLSNLLLSGRDIAAEHGALIHFLERQDEDVILVSSEVGLGIVPDNALARQFRDHAGMLNQKIAGCATRVYFIAAGLPLILKG